MNRLFTKLIVKLLIRGGSTHHLKFGLTRPHQPIQPITVFRLAQYHRRVPYMLQALDAQGCDAFDQHSFHFYLKHEDQIIAVIRYSPAPFELEQLYLKDQLSQLIHKKQWVKTLEISRLIVDDECVYKGLMPALMLYSSLYLLRYTSYRYYLTYCTHANADKFKAFRGQKPNAVFYLEQRAKQQYFLYFGHLGYAILRGLLCAIQRKLKSI